MLQLTNVVEILQTHVSKIPKLNSVGENLGQYIDAGDWQTATIQWSTYYMVNLLHLYKSPVVAVVFVIDSKLE